MHLDIFLQNIFIPWFSIGFHYFNTVMFYCITVMMFALFSYLEQNIISGKLFKFEISPKT